MIKSASLKKNINDFSGWINSRSLRERILIFCVAQIAVLAIIIIGMVSPRWQLHRELAHEMVTRDAQLSRISAETASLKTVETSDLDSSNLALLNKINLQSDQSRADLIKLHNTLFKTEDMVLRLHEIINIHGKLKLISINTLPIENLMQEKLTIEKNSATRPVPLIPVPGVIISPVIDGVYRHSVMVVVQGSYLDIVDYLLALESGTSEFYWENMKMHVDTYPLVTMQITLSTLSIDKKWLIL